MPHYDRYYPDYLRKYPGIEGRPDVLRELRKSDRKMKYIESDLKREAFIEDQQKKIAKFVPSREDSYERITEEEQRQFASNESDPEEQIIRDQELDLLRTALEQLDDQERKLINALYFRGISERQFAQEVKKHYMTIHSRKISILKKIKKYMTK